MLLLIAKLVIALALLGSSAFMRGRSFLFKWKFLILPVAVTIIFAALIYYSFLHYEFWEQNELLRTLGSDDSFTNELESLGFGSAGDFLIASFQVLDNFIKFLFPSYTGGEYLLFFLLTRLWGEYLISFVFALFFLWIASALNKKYSEKFFYGEEPYFGAVAIFLTGWPGWLYYLIILLSLFIIFSFFGTLRKGGEARFSLYFFWLPIAILVISLMHYYKLELPYYLLLKI